MKELIFKNQEGEELHHIKFTEPNEHPSIHIGSDAIFPTGFANIILSPGLYTIEVTDPDDPQPQDWAKENPSLHEMAVKAAMNGVDLEKTGAALGELLAPVLELYIKNAKYLQKGGNNG